MEQNKEYDDHFFQEKYKASIYKQIEENTLPKKERTTYQRHDTNVVNKGEWKCIADLWYEVYSNPKYMYWYAGITGGKMSNRLVANNGRHEYFRAFDRKLAPVGCKLNEDHPCVLDWLDGCLTWTWKINDSFLIPFIEKLLLAETNPLLRAGNYTTKLKFPYYRPGSHVRDTLYNRLVSKKRLFGAIVTGVIVTMDNKVPNIEEIWPVLRGVEDEENGELFTGLGKRKRLEDKETQTKKICI